MSGIEELRERVMDAEKCFGSNDAQRVEYSERLMVMMNAVEGRIREQQDENAQQAAKIETHEVEVAAQRAKIDAQRTAIAQQAEEIEKLETASVGSGAENEQLRDMLHDLLQAIESSGHDGLTETMQQLDRKVSTLVDLAAMAPVAELAVAESIEWVDESPVEADVGVGPGSIEPLEEVDEAGTETAAMVEPALEEIAEPVTEVPDESILEAAPEATLEAAPETAPEYTPEFSAETAAEFSTATTAETAAETTAEISDEFPGGSLDEILERVSRLVEETEAAIAMPVPCAPEATSGLGAEWVANAVAEDLADDAVEAPAQLATGTDS